MNPMPDDFKGEMGPSNFPWLTRAIHWLILHTWFRKFMAQLDADSIQHDWEWSAKAYEAGGGTYQDFIGSNLSLHGRYYKTTGSKWFSDRCCNMVSFVGYPGFPFINEDERNKAKAAALAFWTERGQTFGVTLRRVAVVLSGLGLGSSATTLNEWVATISGVVTGIAWLVSLVNDRMIRQQKAQAEPPK
jgi:hypothetical protein